MPIQAAGSQKYLRDYSELKNGLQPINLKGSVKNCVVIPAFDESSDDVLQSLNTLFEASPEGLLIILVINSKKSSSTEILEKSNALFRNLHHDFQLAHQQKNQSLLVRDELQILVLDHFSAGNQFEDNQGVGLARKIGCDFALWYFQNAQLDSNWIWTTDCDVRVPKSYFQIENFLGQQTVAFHSPFRHDFSDLHKDERTALAFYETSIRFFRLGLHHAGSLYDHHSIGSCLSFDLETYASTRGFPRRLAGEDFYLLNKMRKLGDISTKPNDPLHIKGRTKKRTPFGTAAGTQNTMDLLASGHDFKLYDPKCFEILGQVLSQLDQYSRHRDLKRFETDLSKASQDASEAFQNFDYKKVFSQLNRHARTQATFLRALHESFDGFRQLKFINQLTERDFPKRFYAEAIATLLPDLNLSDIEALCVLKAIQERDEESPQNA